MGSNRKLFWRRSKKVKKNSWSQTLSLLLRVLHTPLFPTPQSFLTDTIARIHSPMHKNIINQQFAQMFNSLKKHLRMNVNMKHTVSMKRLNTNHERLTFSWGGKKINRADSWLPVVQEHEHKHTNTEYSEQTGLCTGGAPAELPSSSPTALCQGCCLDCCTYRLYMRRVSGSGRQLVGEIKVCLPFLFFLVFKCQLKPGFLAAHDPARV